MTEADKRFETLCLLVEQNSGEGVYMMGHLSHEERDAITAAKSDAYKTGWNDCLMSGASRAHKLLEQAEAGVSEDVRLLLASGGAFWDEGQLSLNMNDTWGWATAWCPDVPEEQVAEVARLFRCYGRAGLLYWHSRQEKNMRSEFHDINRMIDFVRQEERIRTETPKSSERAYRKVFYIIGDGSDGPIPEREFTSGDDVEDTSGGRTP